MEGVVNSICQWKNCVSPAEKHVVVGLRVFDSVDDVHISGTPYIPEHFDLCIKHLDLARLQYVHVTEYNLGECPKQTDHDLKASADA